MAATKCLVTGANGQIGYYLTRALHSRGHKVYALVRDKSKVNQADYPKGCEIVECDITDGYLNNVVNDISPAYVFNMAGYSHIGNSFNQPEMAITTNLLPVIRLAEMAKTKGFTLVQASSYEVFAGNPGGVVDETSCVKPVSPYSIAKAAADAHIQLSRKKGVRAYSVYFGNAESIRRPNNFVTSKIVNYLRAADYSAPLSLGYIDAIRDWGFAGEYASIVAEIPGVAHMQDFMLCTGFGTTVRKFISLAAACKNCKVVWEGEGVNERGTIVDFNYDRVADIVIDSNLYRPADVPRLIGRNTMCRNLFGRGPGVTLEKTISYMMYGDPSNVYSKT